MGKKFPEEADRKGIVKEVTSSSESVSMTEIAGGPEAETPLDDGSLITGIVGTAADEPPDELGTFI